MFRRGLGVVGLVTLGLLVGCTTTAPFISALTGLPASIIIPAAVVLTASGGPGSSSGLFTWTFSTTCGGTFTSTTTPNNGPANPLIIGPTSATTVQVTYNSTGATPGACTFTVKLVTSSGRSATLQVTTTINARILTVTKAGTGSGTVTSNPAGINCGATCVAGFDDGTVVTLTATPDAGSKFDGWSGDPDCSDGQVTMDADKACTATFTLLTADLSLTKVDAPDPVIYGNNVTYTLTVTNNGPDAATNVTLTDTLPTTVVFVSVTPGAPTCTYNAGPHTVTCSWASIPVAGNQVVTIVVQAKATGIDLVVNDDAGSCAYTGAASDTASVTATEPDPVPGDNTATADTTINANYTTISAAITAASAGQKIFVCPGTYNESLIITKALTITGAGIALVTINPTTTGYGIEVSGGGSNVTLEQFTLNAGNSRNFMIHVSNVSNFTIQDAKLVGAGRLVQPGGQPLGGVDLNTVTTALIKNVEVQDVSRNGISLTNSTGVTIDTANVHDTGVSTGWAGITVYATTGTTSATFAGTSTVTNTPMGLYVQDELGTTVNLALSSGITFSGQIVAPIVRLGLGTVPGLEATGPTAAFAEALGLVARLTVPEFPASPQNKGAAFFYTVTAAISAAVASPAPYPSYAVVYDLNLDEFFVGNGMVIQRAINAASSGGKVNVLAGTYTESLGGWRDIEIFKSLSIVGAGSGQTIVQLSNKQNGVEIRPDAIGVVLIQGMTFTKMPANPYAAGFAIRLGETGGTFNSVTFRDVEVAYASARNVHFDNATYNSIVMENCNFHHSGAWGLSIRGTLGTVTITNCNFDYNGQVDANHGIGLDFEAPNITGSVTVTGGTMHYNKAKGINMANVRNITFNGVSARWNSGATFPAGGYGASLWEYVGTSQNIKFINCILRQNGTDGLLIGAETGKTVDGVEVIGGELRGNPRAGLLIWNEGGTIQNISVHGAFIAGNTQWGIFTNTTQVVDAENNWWNFASGPYDPNGTNEVEPGPPWTCATDPTNDLNANGQGNRVSDNVDYCPWLTSQP